ncbi:MAG: hypothetical protein ACUVX1_18495, partial [Chloroflexota bacterium]
MDDLGDGDVEWVEGEEGCSGPGQRFTEESAEEVPGGQGRCRDCEGEGEDADGHLGFEGAVGDIEGMRWVDAEEGSGLIVGVLGEADEPHRDYAGVFGEEGIGPARGEGGLDEAEGALVPLQGAGDGVEGPRDERRQEEYSLA